VIDCYNKNGIIYELFKQASKQASKQAKMILLSTHAHRAFSQTSYPQVIVRDNDA
jgi:hypothetical protein